MRRKQMAALLLAVVMAGSSLGSVAAEGMGEAWQATAELPEEAGNREEERAALTGLAEAEADEAAAAAEKTGDDMSSAADSEELVVSEELLPEGEDLESATEGWEEAWTRNGEVEPEDLIVDEEILEEQADETTGDQAANTWKYGNFTYQFDAYFKDEIVLVGYAGEETDLVIPDEIDGHLVTGLSSSFLSSETDYYPSIKTVTIGKNITGMGLMAFSGCSELEAYQVAEGNQYYRMIGDLVYSLDGLRCVKCPTKKTGAVVLPEGTESIAASAFYETGIASVALPDTVEIIGEQAFAFCRQLTEVTLGEGLGFIGNQVFYWCNQLRKLRVPRSVYFVGEEAFTIFIMEGTVSSLVIEGYENTVVERAARASGCPFTAIGKEDYKVLDQGICGEDLTWKVDSKGVLTISGKGPMYDYYEMGSYPGWSDSDKFKTREINRVVIEEGVTSVGAWALSYLEKVSSVSLPFTLKTIGFAAFRGCTMLEQIMLPEGLTSIGDKAFLDVYLQMVAVPSSVTKIGSYAFDYYTIEGNSSSWNYPSHSGILTMYVYQGSAAQTYAKEYNVNARFMAADACCADPTSGHAKVVTTAPKAASYTADGCTEGSKCSRCGKVLSVSSVLPKLELKLDQSALTLYQAQTRQLKLQGAKGAVAWTSSNKSVATVTSSGLVKAVKAGSAVITASVSGVKRTCKVTVKTPTVSKTSLTLLAGQSYQLSMLGGTGKITWKTSNAKVVKVTSKGKLTALKAGKATISVTRNKKTTKCKVTVRKNQVSYKVSKNARDYRYGEPVGALSKAYFSNGKLVVDMWVMNARWYYARYFSWWKVNIYTRDGRLLATKKFKNIPLNLSAFSSKKVTLTFPASAVKIKDYDLSKGIYFSDDYYYYWYYHK
ncbi:MAG: leucine-rich repeat protein [Lachnospiraceae bacterium]|nr:leucine-rich repeat protein [Lachnospiraceae bacterium]